PVSTANSYPVACCYCLCCQNRFCCQLGRGFLHIEARSGAEEVGFEPTTRDTESMGVYQRLLCAQKPHWMSTKVAYYLSLSIGSAVSFAVSRVQQEANLLAKVETCKNP